MNGTRRVLAQSNSGRFKVLEEPIPQPKRGEVLVEVFASAISPGTELGRFVGRSQGAAGEERWRTFGYQNAGVVLAVGEGCSGVEVGQRVVGMGGGYAIHGTHACVPVNLMAALPESVSFEEGAFVALLATALNAVRRAELQLGENALVMGLGPVGQFTCQLAHIAGVHVLAVDRLPLRTEAALRCGADAVCQDASELPGLAAEFTHGYGMDAGFICFGGDGTEAFQQIVSTMKVAPDTHVYGRVVNVGGASITHRFGAALGNLDIRSAARTGPGYHDEEYEHGANYPRVFVPWTTKRNIEELMAWVAAGRLHVKELITHAPMLDEGPEACREIIEHPEKTLGVVLKMR